MKTLIARLFVIGFLTSAFTVRTYSDTVEAGATQAGEYSTASNFHISSQSSVSKQIKDCWTAVWSDEKYGLILKKSVTVTIPIQIRIESAKN